MILDSSAIVAILLKESGHEGLSSKLASAPSLGIGSRCRLGYGRRVLLKRPESVCRARNSARCEPGDREGTLCDWGAAAEDRDAGQGGGGCGTGNRTLNPPGPTTCSFC